MDISFNEIRIRNAVFADCQQLSEWWNDGTVMAHAGFLNGIGTTADEVSRQIAHECDEKGRALIIEYSGRLIGEMGQISKGRSEGTKQGGRLFGGGLFCHLKRNFAGNMPDSCFHGV